MKRARRLFALLLTLAMVLTYMPAAAFANTYESDGESFPKPESVEFVDSTKVTAMIGQDWLYENDLYGKGNKFVVTYSDGSKETFKYGTFKDGSDSFKAFGYKNEEGWLKTAWPEFGTVKGFKKGTSTVKGNLIIWADGYDEEFRLPFSVKVKASKYYTYAVCKAYTYTGKTITPKVKGVYVAKDNGKMTKLKSSKYTYKPKKGKKIGSYTFKVKLKSKKDKKKYGDIECWYAICPKAPTGVSATAGSGKVTVKWKKQSNVDSFAVMVSRDKEFNDIERWENAGKNKTSLTVKELDKGTYYVSVMAIKNDVGSNTGKVIKVTIK